MLRFVEARWLSSCNFFCARRAENFRGLRNFFAEVGRKICVVPTLDAFFFGSECNADSINSQRRCESMRSERWPSPRKSYARGVPDFRKSCKFFARFLRKICVISTLHPRVILRSSARRFRKELLLSPAVRATTLTEFTQLLCARRTKIFRKL